MKEKFFFMLLFAFGSAMVNGQTSAPSPASAPARSTQTATKNAPSVATQQPDAAASFELSDYGVRIEPEPRLIVVMAALDAAGFDPTPAGTEISSFRARVRKDNAALDESLRARLRSFYERNKLPAPATAADQSARYVSLAYALGPAPYFDAPARTNDLPAGVREVLDFAPLVREFYNASNMAARLPEYLKLYAAETERLRRATPEMIRTVLSYLHTRPVTTISERVPVRNSSASANKQKTPAPNFTVREHARRFFVVPDLLAAPGAINFRIIADDYYAIVPAGTDPAASELRRAYLQYVIDPLILRFNHDIAARREQIKKLLDDKAQSGARISPDVFLAVTRSLVAASDARLDEASRLTVLNRATQIELQSAKTEAEHATIVKKSQEMRSAINDEIIAQLADADDRGAVLAFYFADQLRGIETSGFDISNFFADMIASFDPAREANRATEIFAARRRALAARESRRTQRGKASETGISDSARDAVLVKSLLDVNEMLKTRNYVAAEEHLRALLPEFQNEPRVFFALGQAASLSAETATDENVQSERLNNALEQYNAALKLSTADTDRTLLARAHEARGRIFAFLERPNEAIKEFDAAIAIGTVGGKAYNDALAERQKLSPPK